MSRRGARRSALFTLYKWDLTGKPIAEVIEPDADEYTRQIVEEVARRAGELDTRITASAQDWRADRLGVVERNVLRIAIHEIETHAVPPEVAIDEAVTLAKRYASEDAGKLVNGILGRVAREEAA
jgi:N utilization substance protein B